MLTNQTKTAPCLYFLNKFYHQHKIIYLKQFRPSICFLCMSKVGRLNLVPPNQRMPWTQMSRAAICSQEGASPPPAAHICCSKRGKQTCNLRSCETTHSGAKCRGASVANMNYYQKHNADKKSIPHSPVKLPIPRVRCASVNVSRNRRSKKLYQQTGRPIN